MAAYKDNPHGLEDRKQQMKEEFKEDKDDLGQHSVAVNDEAKNKSVKKNGISILVILK